MKLIVVIATIIGVFAVGFVAGQSHSIGALQEILKTPITAVALIASLLALVGSISGPVVAYRMGVRQAGIASVQASAAKTSADAAMTTALGAGNRALAVVRLDWIKALRENLSEYHAILMSTEDPDSSLTGEEAKTAEQKAEADERRLSYLGTQLDLLLNRQKPLQEKLWKISDDILNLETKDERQARDEELVVAARAVLDFEWQKIKREMRGA